MRAVALALSENLLAERGRWPLWLPAAAGAGIGSYFALGVEPAWWWGAGALLCAAVMTVAVRRRPWLLVAAILAATAAAGFTLAQVRALAVAAPVLSSKVGPIYVTGRVVEVEARGSGWRVVLDEVRLAGRRAPDSAATPARVRLRLHDPGPAREPGLWITVRAVLLPPPPPAAPGAFDFQRRAWFRRIGAVGYALGRPQPADAPAGAAANAGWRLRIEALRQRTATRVRAALPGDSGGVAAALMTGKRGAIPADVLQAIRDSGLAHLLAISGLHIGLVAGLVFFGLRASLALVPWVALRYPIKKWAATAALAAAFAYLVLAGATVPTQRAFLMIGLMLVAVLLDRTAITMRPVALAAAVVLALRPESLLSASFQMSFAAVVALVAGYEFLTPRLVAWRRGDGAGGWRRTAFAYIGGVAVTSIIAIVATTPFAIHHFNRLTDYGLAANVIAVPLTALWIMPWGLVAFALLPFGAEGVALVPMGWGIDLVIEVARTVAGWPGAVRRVPVLPAGGLALIALGGLWLCLWQRRWRLYGLVAIVAGLATMAALRPPDILVTGDGKLIGARAADGRYMLSSLRAARFAAERWRQRAGAPDGTAWPRLGASADGRLRCDSLGCLYRRDGRTAALVRDPRALADDCRTAEVIVATVPVRGACPSATWLIDRFDLWRDGAHAVWLERGAVRVESVNGVRGHRPWVPAR